MDVLLMSSGQTFEHPQAQARGITTTVNVSFPPLSTHTSVLTFSQHPRAGPYIGDVP
jgi:hypothetical protein